MVATEKTCGTVSPWRSNWRIALLQCVHEFRRHFCFQYLSLRWGVLRQYAEQELQSVSAYQLLVHEGAVVEEILGTIKEKEIGNLVMATRGRMRLFSGASEPPVAMMQGFRELTGAEIIHAYGATETSLLVTMNRLKPWLERELTDDQKWDLKRKQGFAVVGLDVKVVDALGQECRQTAEPPEKSLSAVPGSPLLIMTLRALRRSLLMMGIGRVMMWAPSMQRAI